MKEAINEVVLAAELAKRGIVNTNLLSRAEILSIIKEIQIGQMERRTFFSNFISNLEAKFCPAPRTDEEHREANRESRKEKRNRVIKKLLIIKFKRNGAKLRVSIKIKN